MKKQILAMLIVLGSVNPVLSGDMDSSDIDDGAKSVFIWAYNLLVGTDIDSTKLNLKIQPPSELNRARSDESTGTPITVLRQIAKDEKRRADAEKRRADAEKRRADAAEEELKRPNKLQGQEGADEIGLRRSSMSFPEELWKYTPPSSPIRAH